MVILRQNQKYQAKRSMHTCSIRLREFSHTLQVANVLVANKKQKSKSNLLFKQQSILIASGFVLSQVIIFIKLWYFFPLWMFTMSIFQIGFNVQMDLRRCHFFFFKQPPHQQVEKMVHTSQLEANQRKWF